MDLTPLSAKHRNLGLHGASYLVIGEFYLFILFISCFCVETITALFKTTFNIDFPFDVQEFVAFGFIG